MQASQFVVLPKVSIRPNKLVFYNEFHRVSRLSPTPEICPKKKPTTSVSGIKLEKIKQPKSNTHNFEISKKASSRIKEKVTWLYNLAKNQTVPAPKGKILYSFKMNFITLTMPALQRHDTPTLIKECLNQFLIECSQQFDMKHYLWRLEYQKNGNAHFHIASDTFVPWNISRDIWNRCIEKLGYVSDYHNKNKSKSFEQYLKENPVNEKTTFQTIHKRYIYGRKTAWSKPNTVDVRAVTNSSNIGYYIAKYITKSSKEPLNPIVAARENTDSNMRLWFCSRSLSKVDKISVFLDAIPDKISDCLAQMQEVKKFLCDHCELQFFDIKQQTLEFKRLFRQVLFEYADSVGYFARSKPLAA